MCVCTFENACAAAERESEASSRDAHSVANLATLLLDLTTFQTPLATFFPIKSTSDIYSVVLDKL